MALEPVAPTKVRPRRVLAAQIASRSWALDVEKSGWQPKGNAAPAASSTKRSVRRRYSGRTAVGFVCCCAGLKVRHSVIGSAEVGVIGGGERLLLTACPILREPMRSLILQLSCRSIMVSLLCFGASFAEAQSGSRTRVPASPYRSAQPYSQGGSSTTRSQPAGSSTSRSQPTGNEVGMRGYSPVAVTAGGKWVRGNPQFRSEFDGLVYHMASGDELAKFQASPERYVPALRGDCIVCYTNGGSRVRGSVQHGAMHDGRVYLFPSAREKQEFLSHVEKYATTDIAFGGHCVVCAAKGGQMVQGSQAHVAVQNGFRFMFPSDAERQEFLKQPASYIASAQKIWASRSRTPAGSGASGSGTRSAPGSGTR